MHVPICNSYSPRPVPICNSYSPRSVPICNSYSPRPVPICNSCPRFGIFQVLSGAERLLRDGSLRLLLVELSPLALEAQGSSIKALHALIASYGFDCTFGAFFSAYRSTRHHGAIRYKAASLPKVLEERSSVGTEEMSKLLHRMPQTEMAGWTDLLCWSRRPSSEGI